MRDKDEEEDLGLGLKSVWYAAEALGNVIGATKGDKQESANSSAAPTASSSFSASNLPLPRRKALELLRADYDVDYFISGLGEMRAYADDCEFRDPFAGFKGTARFKKNVSNLGSSLEEAETVLLSWEEREEEGSLKTQWRFSGIVGLLPWRPRLAAAGSTTHVFDPVSLRRGLSSLKRESREGEKEKRTKKKTHFYLKKKLFQKTGLVTKHIEAWASSPSEVVKSLLRPANKLLPGNRWEVAAACVYEGDWRGLWFASAAGVAKVAGGLCAASSAVKLLLLQSSSSNGDFQGPGAAEAALLLLALSAGATVVLDTLGIGDGNVGKRR